jgi:hypothetical protein
MEAILSSTIHFDYKAKQNSLQFINRLKSGLVVDVEAMKKKGSIIIFA